MGCGNKLNPFSNEGLRFTIDPVGDSLIGSSGMFVWELKDQWRAFKHLMVPDMRRDREATINAPDNSRRIIYGRCRVSGQLAYAQSTGDQNQYLHMVVILAGHAVDGFEDVYLDDTLASTIPGNCYYDLFDGTQTTACASLVAASGGLWTDSHILKGCAYIYLRLLYDQNHFASGVPTVKVVTRGKRVYDPRTATTAWSDNPALCCLDYMLTSAELGGMGIIDLAEINMATVIAAANICDELVTASADGLSTEKRYTCNGTLTINVTPRQMLEALLQSMAGDAVCAGGVWQLFAGAFTSPVSTIDETWLNGSLSFAIGTDKGSRINTVTGTYVDPGDNWAIKGFEAVTDNSLIAEDGGEELKQDLTLNFTLTASMGRRLAKIIMRKSRSEASMDYPSNFKAWELSPLDVVAVNNQILGWSGKTFRVTSWGFTAMGGVSLSLRSETAWVYEWGVDDFGAISAYVPPTIPPLTWQHLTTLPDVTGGGTIYKGSLLWLVWQPVYTFDPVRYEVRFGADYNTAMVLGTYTETSAPTAGDGTYWITAVTDWGRSANPETVAVSGSLLTGNVVATFSESAWTGTLTGGAEVDGAGRLWLKTSGGSVVTPGYYEQPAGHVVDLGSVQQCQCSATYAAVSDSPTSLIDSVADFDSIANFDGDYAGYSAVAVQINLSQDASTWEGWQPFVPGPYRARRFKFRLVLTSTSPYVTPAVTAFTTTVDMPDRTQSWTGYSLVASGATLTYADPFQVAPNVQVTILNAASGDYVSVTSATATGFTVRVLNGGSGVARTVNILAKGY